MAAAPKKGLELIIGIGHGKPPMKGGEAEAEPEEEGGPPDLSLEAGAVLKAVKAGDTKALASALQEFFAACRECESE